MLDTDSISDETDNVYIDKTEADDIDISRLLIESMKTLVDRY